MSDLDCWLVHKFGGTSVGSADCIRKCIDIVHASLATSQRRLAVVVSAMGGKPKVTDLLLELVHAAANGRDEEIKLKMSLIQSKHQDCVSSMLSEAPELAQRIMKLIESDLKDIFDLLRAVQLMRSAHEQILELVSGYGEIWSASILAASFKVAGLPFVFLNARDVLFVGELEGVGTQVCWEESQLKLNEFLQETERTWIETNGNGLGLPHLVITGYIASRLDGVATTLKRDGSDFSASIFGRMLKAESITIWTDVSGVYSADPRRVPEAQIIPAVSYSEAIELAYFGAKVIHPKTMAPAIEANIPIFIRNTFASEHEGTRIALYPSATTATTDGFNRRAVCGFTTVDKIALLTLEGTGMVGVPGIAHRLFGALKAAGTSVLFVAAASSEHSICVGLGSQSQGVSAKAAVEEAFFYELRQGFVSEITLLTDCSIIAAVGDGMSQTPGVAGIFFAALGGAGVNILSISQGCDERNISAVVRSNDATKALRAVHAAFLLSSLDLSLGLVGTGRVGSALLSTLLDQREVLSARFGLRINVRGIINSRVMLLGEDLLREETALVRVFIDQGHGVNGVKKSQSGLLHQQPPPQNGQDRSRLEPADLAAFLQHLKGGSTPHAIVIDATPSHGVARLHPLWLRQGCHVVTANKRALADGIDLYNGIFNAARAGGNKLYLSEVTIGASLPVRSTLNDLLCSGDAVHSIVGLYSVSSNVILTHVCDEGLSFTDAVQRVYDRGLFEDDPFVDLAGTEAAEKLLILAREMGGALTIDDIHVEPLATRRNVANWASLDKNVFAEEDANMKRRAQLALEQNCTLRYVQRIDCSPPAEMGRAIGVRSIRASVKLEQVPLDSLQAMVKGPVYHFSFHTARYQQAPLIVQVCFHSNSFSFDSQVLFNRVHWQTVQIQPLECLATYFALHVHSVPKIVDLMN